MNRRGMMAVQTASNPNVIEWSAGQPLPDCVTLSATGSGVAQLQGDGTLLIKAGSETGGNGEAKASLNTGGRYIKSMEATIDQRVASGYCYLFFCSITNPNGRIMFFASHSAMSSYNNQKFRYGNSSHAKAEMNATAMTSAGLSTPVTFKLEGMGINSTGFTAYVNGVQKYTNSATDYYTATTDALPMFMAQKSNVSGGFYVSHFKIEYYEEE